MMKPGKIQSAPDEAKQSREKHHTGPFSSGVVIVAEIAFAALLLYLTNHPVEFNDLTQASGPAAQELDSNPVLGGPAASLTKPGSLPGIRTAPETGAAIGTGADASRTPATKVAVAVNRIESIEPLLNN